MMETLRRVVCDSCRKEAVSHQICWSDGSVYLVCVGCLPRLGDPDVDRIVQFGRER